MGTIILETDRLILRQMTQEDFGGLCRILQDEVVMYAYGHAFCDEEAQQWLDRQLQRYADYGFGLWAVILKSDGKMIGQCGLTMQDCGGEQVVEIGYLFQKDCWHKGYAIEAAAECKAYAFEKLGIEKVYSIIRDTNIASQKVAIRNGMTKTGEFVKHYNNEDMLHFVYETAR